MTDENGTPEEGVGVGTDERGSARWETIGGDEPPDPKLDLSRHPPLLDAAQWIARVTGQDLRTGYEVLFQMIEDGENTLYGRRGGVGDPERVPSDDVRNIPIDLDQGIGLSLSDETYLDGYTNAIWSRGRKKWGDLNVDGAAIARYWPILVDTRAFPSRGERGRYAIDLFLWNDRNEENEELNKAVAARMAAVKDQLKIDLTPARKAALRDVVEGKGDAKGIIETLRPVPHLLDTVRLPHTARVEAIRALTADSRAPLGWIDPFWTPGQMILWAVTGDRWAVDHAGTKCSPGAWLAQEKARHAINALMLPREAIEDAADNLRLLCLNGTVQALDSRGQAIPKTDWLNLGIVLTSDNLLMVLRRGQPSTAPGESVLFPRDAATALREFPTEPAADTSVAARETDDLTEQRKRVVNWFIRRQQRIAPEKRVWFSLTEIADEFATKKGSFTVDNKERAGALEALRRSILAREFSCVLNVAHDVPPSELARFRLNPDGAAIPELFNRIIPHLWVRYEDCVAWSDRHGRELPHRLRRDLQSSETPELTRPDAEPPVPSKRSKPVTVEDKKANALKIAWKHVGPDGKAPSLKDHTTLVKKDLNAGPPEYRVKREELDGNGKGGPIGWLRTEFAEIRRGSGNPRSNR